MKLKRSWLAALISLVVVVIFSITTLGTAEDPSPPSSIRSLS